jgi:hypothetical protein
MLLEMLPADGEQRGAYAPIGIILAWYIATEYCSISLPNDKEKVYPFPVTKKEVEPV